MSNQAAVELADRNFSAGKSMRQALLEEMNMQESDVPKIPRFTLNKNNIASIEKAIFEVGKNIFLI